MIFLMTVFETVVPSYHAGLLSIRLQTSFVSFKDSDRSFPPARCALYDESGWDNRSSYS